MRSIPRTGKRAFAGALVMGAIGVLVAPEVAQAHFILNSPPAWMSQDTLGVPEKLGPCGDESDGTDAATPTNIVTAYQQGQTITVTVNEVIFHPGHYRIALAVNGRSELPAEPAVTVGSTSCGSAAVQNPPVFPVLADGVFTHTAAFTGPQSIQITLPANVTCTKCTLQVIEFMAEHGLNMPGGCFYHHCADLSIQASEGGAVMSVADSGGAVDAGSVGSSADASSGGDASGASLGTDGDNTIGSSTGGTGGGTSKDSSSSGCSLAAGRAASGVACIVGVGGVALLARRRRRARAARRA